MTYSQMDMSDELGFEKTYLENNIMKFGYTLTLNTEKKIINFLTDLFYELIRCLSDQIQLFKIYGQINTLNFNSTLIH